VIDFITVRFSKNKYYNDDDDDDKPVIFCDTCNNR